MRDIILILLVILLMAYANWFYPVTNNAPECVFAQDVITCVQLYKIIKKER